MEEIRKELTLEELEAQTVELLPDREEMQATAVSSAVNTGAGVSLSTAVATSP